ncbi:o-succinylbenzoate synthase [Psychroflexus planctonicus]|uniref:O-succinylbenzoate synthase n=1 Tax=Psychroflexus planctonicus TaxID=1526575 RepID=A0ABQ1SKN5_9FLAO|nr:o-succinylbenzoate synthase [Psychroflexus planctonicus]GGE44649.1 o-succinylbenzoate synthase [Psychroflexus planctonicus]
MKATYQKYILEFKRPSGTSRGVLKTKETWFIQLTENENYGIGECGILRGLSVDDRPDYEEKLHWTCQNIHLGKEKLLEELTEFPSIQIGVEMALASIAASHPHVLFSSNFTQGKTGITINGLIWMGEFDFMKKQIEEKLQQGFSCVKLKIGAIDFEAELELLKKIRKDFSPEEVELRVDANGAFHPNDALEKLKRLSEFNLHSIEQPIKANQWESMADLCEKTPLPIALDEELIGVFDVTNREKMLQTIQPQYIILKPSLVGGFLQTKNWIDLAENQETGWWITSALESNVGLNAIAQFTQTLQNEMPQGLGTGSLYTNNIPSPLEVKGEKLWYNPQLKWGKI